MAFWAIEVKPGNPYIHRYDEQLGRLHISQATLGDHSSSEKILLQCNVGDKSLMYLCCLLPGENETCSLNLKFEEEDEVTFSVIGPHSVHLFGYFCRKREDQCGHDHESKKNIKKKRKKQDSVVEAITNVEKKPKAKPIQERTFTTGFVTHELNLGGPDGKEASPRTEVSVRSRKLKKNSATFNSNIGGAKSRLGIGRVKYGKQSRKNKREKTEKKEKVKGYGNGSDVAVLPVEETPAHVNQAVGTENKKLEVPTGKRKKNRKKKSKKKPEAKPLQVRIFPNGFVIQELEMGRPDGKEAIPGTEVSVRYSGKLKDNNSEFISNMNNKAPFKFRLGIGRVMKGWDVGVTGMRVGDKRLLTIPPTMGYGSGKQGAGRTTPSNIPPDSWLVFDVELVDVN